MNIRPIRTEDDYQTALREVSALFDQEPEPGSPEGDRFEVLLTLIEAYETQHFPIDLPDPIAAIQFRMEQAGLTPKDLQPMIGRLNRVYEVLNRKRPLTLNMIVLNRKRPLTLNMIWKLHRGLGIPAETLIRPPSQRLMDMGSEQ